MAIFYTLLQTKKFGSRDLEIINIHFHGPYVVKFAWSAQAPIQTFALVFGVYPG